MVTGQEDFALAVLFSRRAGAETNGKDPRSFMFFLPQLFIAAKPNSPLQRATCALALFTCQYILDYKGTSRLNFQLGRKALGEALRLNHHAMEDPITCLSDETLMAVMLLDIIHKILCLVGRHTPTEVHLTGAAQLIKLRGPKNLENVLSQRILAGVVSETAGKALSQRVPVKTVVNSLCSSGQINNLTQSLDTATDLLNHLAERVANVQAPIRAFVGCRSLSENLRAGALLAAVLKIDQDLIDWECAIPSDWCHQPAADMSAARLAAFQAYCTTIDIYSSVGIANTYNSFRMLRILVQTLAYEITCSYPQARASIVPSGPLDYASTVQRLVDDICASVPYCMGTRNVGMHSSEIHFSAAKGMVQSFADRETSVQVGAWLLRAPLKTCATSELIDEQQRTWIVSQMDRIDDLYDLRGTDQGLVPNWKISLASKVSSPSGNKLPYLRRFEALSALPTEDVD
jgi:hypothetical protein